MAEDSDGSGHTGSDADRKGGRYSQAVGEVVNSVAQDNHQRQGRHRWGMQGLNMTNINASGGIAEECKG